MVQFQLKILIFFNANRVDDDDDDDDGKEEIYMFPSKTPSQLWDGIDDGDDEEEEKDDKEEGDVSKVINIIQTRAVHFRQHNDRHWGREGGSLACTGEKSLFHSLTFSQPFDGRRQKNPQQDDRFNTAYLLMFQGGSFPGYLAPWQLTVGLCIGTA